MNNPRKTLLCVIAICVGATAAIAADESKEISIVRRDPQDQPPPVKKKLRLIKVGWDPLKNKLKNTTKKINLGFEGGHYTVSALINGTAKARLLIDTGASVVVLPIEYKEYLQFDETKSKHNPIYLKIANGQKIKAWPVVLQNISIGDVTAKNVEAAILSKTVQGFGPTDGLLGMSFLKRYNFSFDFKNKCLMLAEPA